MLQIAVMMHSSGRKECCFCGKSSGNNHKEVQPSYQLKVKLGRKSSFEKSALINVIEITWIKAGIHMGNQKSEIVDIAILKDIYYHAIMGNLDILY